MSASEHWIPGGMTSDRAIECGTLRIPDNVESIKAERQTAEKLDVQVCFPSWQADVAGDPMSMRRMVNQVSDTRPIALQLSKTRSVDVYAVNSGRKSFSRGPLNGESFDWSVMVKLPKPVSASNLSYWLCHQATNDCQE
jgi:hypothetical protein